MWPYQLQPLAKRNTNLQFSKIFKNWPFWNGNVIAKEKATFFLPAKINSGAWAFIYTYETRYIHIWKTHVYVCLHDCIFNITVSIVTSSLTIPHSIYMLDQTQCRISKRAKIFVKIFVPLYFLYKHTHFFCCCSCCSWQINTYRNASVCECVCVHWIPHIKFKMK